MIFENFEISIVLLGQFQNVQKMHSGNLFQIALSNMRLLAQIVNINYIIIIYPN